MEITYKTEISELIDVGKVQSKVSSIEGVIDEYSDKGDEVLRKELSSNLSENTFYYGSNHPIFDKATTLCTSFSSIDTSVLSTIISKAKEKREEELLRLKSEVQKRIEEITNQLQANLSRIRELCLSKDAEATSQIDKIKAENHKLIDEKQKLKEKLEKIESELGDL